MSANPTSPSPAPPPPREPSPRELDAEIAVRLFGYGKGIIDMAREGRLKLVTDDVECGPYLIGPPAYSTDPAAMMELWQALLKRPNVYEVTLQGYSESLEPLVDDQFAAEIFFERRDGVLEFAATPMRALCLAALAAVPPEGTVPRA